jgi:hypothetical protein
MSEAHLRDIVRFAHSSPEGLLMDADYFLRRGAKNNRHPRKSPERRVSEANNVASIANSDF